MMQKLYEQAYKLVGKAKVIAKVLSKYNTGTNSEKVSIGDIQHMIAELTQGYVEIYTELKRIKENGC
jgi:type III secretory pathway component EscV